MSHLHPSIMRSPRIARTVARSRIGSLFPLALALAVFLLVLAGCGSDSSAATTSPTDTPQPAATTPATTPATTAPGSGNAVTIEDFDFSPQTLKVKVGTTVTWTYDPNGGIDHTVTSNTGAFHSATLTPGTTFTFTFHQAGTYKYHCSIHPFMTGEIDVS